MSDIEETIAQRIAAELGVRQSQVESTVALIDGGATVPFIARYRKEVTGALDDAQLRTLDERLRYLRELEDRRGAVLASIDDQGKLTAELRAKILAADTKTRLEDLYLPFKKKRRTKGQIARERGLEPLAHGLLRDPTLDPTTLARDFVDPEREVPDVEAALEGAQQILMEDFAEDAELVTDLREWSWAHALAQTTLSSKGKAEEGSKFRDWFDHCEPLRNVPSHRALAFLRGRVEGILRLRFVVGDDRVELNRDPSGVCVGRVCRRFGIAERGRPADRFLLETAQLAWRIKISLRVETDLVARLRSAAEVEAIEVFAKNLHDLLLAAPAGPQRILGLDPGLRTGVKVAVVDETGRVVDTTTVFPTPPRSQVAETLAVLERLVTVHRVSLISIGNGTGSRETERCVAQLLKRPGCAAVHKVVTNEAGASVYSASELASHELPDLDVSLRGAVSIARRVQDPLAELVKIDPKSIGVGQYQHDVDQRKLGSSLENVVEDCVNGVGVDVNTASPALLARVAGLSAGLADGIVAHRDKNGAFSERKQLMKVARLGPKAYEQAAGFLRIRDGANPLDASAVHPEAYPVVRRIEKQSGRKVTQMIGDVAFLRSLDPADFIDEKFGLPTVQDILIELEKPGRDPRPEWKTAKFEEGVEEIGDLVPGMQLEGVVSNVANFGAFVDIGVHQDGLVHISCLADEFVEDPRAVVKAGDVVRVKVLEVDIERRRIALTMRMTDEPGADRRGGGGRRRDSERTQRSSGSERAESSGGRRPEPVPENPFAKAFGKLPRE